MAGPFRDISVIEVPRGQAARMAGMLLADLGADVVRVAAPRALGVAKDIGAHVAVAAINHAMGIAA
jgi:crotonobetainyl-CoA:carnitine CoA-transferase CaiB-like acyl-CoA transferase